MEVLLSFLQKFPLKLFRAVASLSAISIIASNANNSPFEELLPLAWLARGAETIHWDSCAQRLSSVDSWLGSFMPGLASLLVAFICLAFVCASRRDQSYGPGNSIRVNLNSHASATFWYLALLLAYAEVSQWQVFLALAITTVGWCIVNAIRNRSRRNATEPAFMAFLSVCGSAVWLPGYLLGLFFFAKSSDNSSEKSN